MIRTLASLLATAFVAAGAAAQTAEFGRGSGGVIEAITKSPKRFSGSLGLSRSSGLFQGNGYEGSLGGELVDERLWFFAAASVLPAVVKVTAQPVDWTSVAATFSQTAEQPDQLTPPSSFLSLRSTSVLSDRMTLSFSVSALRAQ